MKLKTLLFAILASALVLSLSTSAKTNTFISTEIQVEGGFTAIIASWSNIDQIQKDHDINIRFRQDNKWSNWYLLEPDYDNLAPNEKKITAFFATNHSAAYQYRISDFGDHDTINTLLENLSFDPIYQKPKQFSTTGELLASLSSDITDTYDDLTISSTAPNIISRRQWGADENLRVYKGSESTETDTSEERAEEDTNGEKTELTEYEKFLEKYKEETKIIKAIETNENGEYLTWPLQYPEKIRKIFVHHTATQRNLDNPRQAIRDIYYYHTVSKGWGDIGYNYIIDAEGVIYEGRYGGESVIGAHVAKGNTGSIGIAILGNYENDLLPQKSLESLIQLIGVKASVHHLDPQGKSSFRGEYLDNIVGHRDYSRTACPGKNIYSLFPEIRKLSAKAMSSSFSSDKSFVNISRSKGYDFKVFSKPSNKLFAQKNKQFNFIVKLENSGTYTWKKSGNQLIHIVDSDGNSVGRLMENEVSPGSVGTFEIFANAPSSIGDSKYMIKPVIGTGTSIDNTHISIDLHVFEEKYKAEFVRMSSHTVFSPNEADQGWIELKNTGGETWYRFGENDLFLSKLAPISLDILRFRLFEKAVAPGEVGTIVFTVKVPEREGDYTMFLTPWFDGHTLMDQRIDYPIHVTNNPQSYKIVEPSKPTTQLPVQPKEEPAKIEPTPLPIPLKVETPAPATPITEIDNPTIRVALSYRGNPIITGDGPFSLYDDNEKIVSFDKDEEVFINLYKNQYQIKSDKKSYTTSNPPRFLPGLQTILEIQNYEHRPTWNQTLNDNRYRGILEINIDDGSLMVINELPLETYIRGIGEVSNNSPYEKIKAILVASRTYAKYYLEKDKKFPGKPYDLSDDPEKSQKYLGVGLELRSPNIVKAARETAGEVVKYNDQLVKTPYFNQSAGRTLSAEEVWGWTTTPHLKSVDDPYCDAHTFLGHGVGLSGCGADGMAKVGKDYQEILKYYYQGVEVKK